MKRNHATGTVKSSLTRGAAALSLSALLFTAACSGEADPGTDTSNTSDGVTQDGNSNTDSPDDSSDGPANGTVYGEREVHPPAVEGEFGYLTLRDIGEARLEAAIAGEEDPGSLPGINILIKNGEPIPDNVKEEIEQRYFQQAARMFAVASDVPQDAEYHFDRYSFLSRTAGRLDTLSELSGTYVDIIFPRSMIRESEYLEGYNYYLAVRAWDTTEFVVYTETLDEFLANYEAYLAREGITNYELWVMEPEVTAPWIK